MRQIPMMLDGADTFAKSAHRDSKQWEPSAVGFFCV